ncbi:MAG TPA: ABC transporter substrate-binding protein [Beijerinckiaceae bacterium]|jgi:peptide/nickel transport system substrate-binding protein
MKRSFLTGLIAAAAVAASGLAAGAQSPTHLRFGLAEDPDVLDPTLARTYVGRIVFASLCDKLFDIDEKLNIVPQLALSHETLDDGKAVVIKLRPNVKFHDGEPLDAEAAKYSIERHLTMQGSFRRPELAEVDNVQVVDPLTIRLNLKKPFAPLLSQLTDRAGMMMSPKAAKEAGDKFGQKPVCAGPYKFVERVQQDRIVVERFADYWNKDNVHIDRITYVPITDSTVRLANLKAGQLDVIERMLATDIKDVRSDSRLRLVSTVELGYQGMTINIGKGEPAKGPLGSDPRVREALELSIDRDAINQVVYNGEYLPGNQWLSPEHPFYQKKFPVPKRNVAKAKQLLQAAGVKTPVVVDYMIPNNPETRQAGEVIQAMAAEAGFDMRIRVTEFATSLKEAEDGRYQVYMLNWSGRPDPDGNLYIFHRTRGPQNYSGSSDPEVDAMMDDARTRSDAGERKTIYEKVAEKLLSSRPIIYLYHRKWLIAHTARLDGLKLLPDGLVRVVGLKFK